MRIVECRHSYLSYLPPSLYLLAELIVVRNRVKNELPSSAFWEPRRTEAEASSGKRARSRAIFILSVMMREWVLSTAKDWIVSLLHCLHSNVNYVFRMRVLVVDHYRHYDGATGLWPKNRSQLEGRVQDRNTITFQPSSSRYWRGYSFVYLDLGSTPIHASGTVYTVFSIHDQVAQGRIIQYTAVWYWNLNTDSYQRYILSIRK